MKQFEAVAHFTLISEQPTPSLAHATGTTTMPTRNCITGSKARKGAHKLKSHSANAFVSNVFTSAFRLVDDAAQRYMFALGRESSLKVAGVNYLLEDIAANQNESGSPVAKPPVAAE